MNHDNDHERREVIRRNVYTTIDERLAHLEINVEALDLWIRQELRDLDKHIEANFSHNEIMIAEKAANIAVHRAFSYLGVNIDDPKDLQTFRDDLRFGGVFRSAVQKGFFALIAAICGGIGVSVWLIFRKGLGLP